MFDTVIIILKNELYRHEIALEETPLINDRLQRGYKETISQLQSAIEVLKREGNE